MFGLTQKDIDVYNKIANAGMTAREVYSAYNNGTLAEDLKLTIDEYEAYLDDLYKDKEK